MIDWCSINTLICRLKLKSRYNYRYIWRSPLQTKSRIDHVLIDGEYLSDIIDVWTYRSAKLFMHKNNKATGKNGLGARLSKMSLVTEYALRPYWFQRRIWYCEATMDEYDFPGKLTKLIRATINDMQCSVKISCGLSHPLESRCGCRHSCSLFLENVIRKVNSLLIG